ncbi:hypothetical protein [Bdellovibrio sp. HCB337]|uniref:hypothetical protein n=1 Tax=Bdellovibrio sp. HCB337 TaxID=3394358 RepID=UPI0039A4AB02
MNKFLLFSVLLFQFANAFAFDWNAMATPVKVGGTELKVSKITFDDRNFARQFCEKLNMKLADFSTLEKAAHASPPMKAVLFVADTNDGKISGIWGWNTEKKYLVKDTSIDLKFDGDQEITPTSLDLINQNAPKWGITPYKGLPAVCAPQ